MEYFTILTLDYFEDTLANVVLPDLDWNCDSNDVTRIRRKNVKGELNRIKKTESNPVKKVSKIQPNTVSQIKSNKITSAEMTILMTELAFDNLIILMQRRSACRNHDIDRVLGPYK